MGRRRPSRSLGNPTMLAQQQQQQQQRIHCSVCGQGRARGDFRNLTDYALVCNQCHLIFGFQQPVQRRMRIQSTPADLDPRTDQCCPGCGVVTFRDGGCSHMICLLCGTDWNWQEEEKEGTPPLLIRHDNIFTDIVVQSFLVMLLYMLFKVDPYWSPLIMVAALVVVYRYNFVWFISHILFGAVLGGFIVSMMNLLVLHVRSPTALETFQVVLRESQWEAFQAGLRGWQDLRHCLSTNSTFCFTCPVLPSS